MVSKLGIASDHAGKDLKQLIYDFVKLTDFEIIDFGVSTDAEKAVDYPDYAEILCEAIISGKVDRGVAICGTGIGMCMTSNKFPGIRATLVWDEFSCRLSRAHNDSNLICLGARVLNHYRAVELVKLWLETPFEGERHQLRLKKMREIEKKNFNPR